MCSFKGRRGMMRESLLSLGYAKVCNCVKVPVLDYGRLVLRVLVAGRH